MRSVGENVKGDTAGFVTHGPNMFVASCSPLPTQVKVGQVKVLLVKVMMGIGMTVTLAQELVALPQVFIAITRKKLKGEL